MSHRKVLVAGATGLIGNAVLKALSNDVDTEVIALSRRRPEELHGADFLSVDLKSRPVCQAAFEEVQGITHVVYSALYEKEDLTSGWTDQEQIATNMDMIRNLFDAVLPNNEATLMHITLLQGTKAYGGHVRPFALPAKEGKTDAREIPNFYWEQEGYIKELHKRYNFSYSILRPQIVIGKAIGSAMNLIPALGTYASVLREEGEPLHYPGTRSALIEAVDVDLLARVVVWAGNSEKARNETFNVTNGDVINIKDIWPVIAESFQMEVGEERPVRLADFMPGKKSIWENIADSHHLKTRDMDRFVGQSFQFADRYLNDLEYPLLVSTIKIKEAGFSEVMDSEKMFRKWIRDFKESKLLPE